MSADRLGRGLAIAASVIVVAAVVAAVTVMGGPQQQRLARFDQRRVDDLARIQALVADHVERTGALPADLAVLAEQPGLALAVDDPEGTPYGYEPRTGLRYRLCAAFATDTAERADPRHDDAWRHGRGRHCFDRRAKRPEAAGSEPPPG